MGSDRHYPEEQPVVKLAVDRFAIEQHPVTNAQFAAFVDATGYVTVAERPLDPALYPGAPPENLLPGSLVFTPTDGPVDLGNLSQWWRWVTGASWRSPEGPGSSIIDRGDHPVVQVVAEDAEAYATWCGRRLPSEVEWEYAARGGLEAAAFAWGDDKLPDGRRMAKYFEGAFPYRNTPSDGHEHTAPVGTYPANRYGLVDMCGNVWEWTADWYSETARETSGCCGLDRSRVVNPDESLDPLLPHTPVPRRVIKGGSHLCADEYCQRYRPAARRPQMIDTSMSHIGFRCCT